MGKGRNQRLIMKRDAKLLQRLDYWYEERRLRLDDAVLLLSEEEFFITPETIYNVIRKYNKSPEYQPTKIKVPKLTPQQLALFKDQPQ